MNSASYTTTDVYLAAFLDHKGIDLLDLRRLGPKKVEFRFATNRETHNLIRLYGSDHLVSVIPRELFGSLRRLKNSSINRYDDPFIDPLPRLE
ncbi:MAG: DUF5659 domain-containing protein [Gemmataceae bacterium]